MEKPKFKENLWSCPVCKKDPYKNEADCAVLYLRGGRSVCWCSCGAVSIEDYDTDTLKSWVKTVYNFDHNSNPL